MTAAVSGMTRLRNTIISSRNDSSTTRPMKSGSFELSTLAKSMKMAVVPPTRTFDAGCCRPPGGWWFPQMVDQIGGGGVLGRGGRDRR